MHLAFIESQHVDIPVEPTQVTYVTLLVFSFDYLGGVGSTNLLMMAYAHLHSFGVTLKPITAFGFDVVGLQSTILFVIPASSR